MGDDHDKDTEDPWAVSHESFESAFAFGREVTVYLTSAVTTDSKFNPDPRTRLSGMLLEADEVVGVLLRDTLESIPVFVPMSHVALITWREE